VIDLRHLPHYPMPSAGEVPTDQAPIFYDGGGRPLSRLDVAPVGGDVRIVPRGLGGRIALGEGTFMIWQDDEPFLRRAGQPVNGFGVTFPWNAKLPKRVPVFWHALDDDGRRFRSGEGTLDRFAGAVDDGAWIDTNLHVLADGLVRVFVSERDGTETVHAILPPGDLRSASPQVVREPSFSQSFFGRELFGELRLPLTSSGEASGAVDVSRFSMERYRRLVGAAAAPGFTGTIHVSVTRRADGGARLLIATTKGEPGAFGF
jgi:hypothetical protein